MKRVPLSRKTPLQNKTPMRRNPQKKGVRRRPPGFTEGTKAEVRRRSGNWCEVPGCKSKATQFHHRKLRRFDDHRAVNALHCCGLHHTYIHEHVAESYVRGLLVQSWRDPAEVPIL